MSESHNIFLPVVALDLVGKLDEYLSECACLRQAPNDAEAIGRLRQRLRGMTALARMLPVTWVQWGEFVVAHFKLVRHYYLGGSAAEATLCLLFTRQEQTIEALRRRCVTWVAEQHSPKAVESPAARVNSFAAYNAVLPRIQALRKELEFDAASHIAEGGARRAVLERELADLKDMADSLRTGAIAALDRKLSPC